MKEDIGMSGQDYNLLQTMFTTGYVIGNLASQLIMLKLRPSILLPACEFGWSILVMAMAGAKNLETLLVLRFFIGLLEASAFPGIQLKMILRDRRIWNLLDFSYYKQIGP